MFAEYVIVTAQSCQSGQCAKQVEVKPQVIVVKPSKEAPVIFLAPEPPKSRLALPKLFQRQIQAPVVVICQGGKCK
ncbi:hypothetical protein UFOVP142_25 [uncultured Caudovirales phage]|uniref:Uncharacterized protein n=1 Tax=uncultured Caudovirales phage TaxID=2100421 RepID=A0A6J7XKZ6_9CAUD|nr:hypothetical protein UFOVP142_25 [uncultured Caudovirales phage]